MARYNPDIHHRKSIRLKGYDYAQAGLYFITICVQNRACLFGNVVNNQMLLNDAGKMMDTEWLNLKTRFTNIELHEFITMPNHFHGILEIVGAPLVGAHVGNPHQMDKTKLETTGQPKMTSQPVTPDATGQPQGIAPTEPPIKPHKTVGDIMDAFKSIATVQYIHGVKNWGWQPFDGKLLQRNYYEHIIRNEESYQTISNYIINNPANWANDKFYQ